MEDNEKELSQQESLLIIRQMIDTAKQEQQDDGKGWIIWGWMLFLASVLTVLNIKYSFRNPFFFWDFFGALTLVAFLFRVIRRLFTRPKVKVKTYTKSLFDKLNTGFFVVLSFIIVSMNLGVDVSKGFALLIGLYGFWMLIYGAVLDFKPSIIASIITWALGFVALFQKDFVVIMLLHAAAVLCGYIIPGHLANKKFKKDSAGKSFNQPGIV